MERTKREKETHVKHSIGRWATALLGVAALGLCMGAMAGQYEPGRGYTFKLGEGIDATVGADMQIRLEGYDRDVVDPDMAKMDNGPAYQYLRLRERAWFGVKVEDWMKFNARLVNRWQYFSSRPGENNADMATWEFPDETVFDLLNLQLLEIGDSDWSLTIGRQELPLGNGMVFLEGTPADQGRTIYFDGISATMKQERDTLKLFAFYNSYRDKTLVINDQERRLRRGDIFTTGAYWTHAYNTDLDKEGRKALNTDLYYIFANVTGNAATEQGDDDDEFHTVGFRLFGAPHAQVDYSFEIARQFGYAQKVEEIDLSNCMIDARLTLKAAKDSKVLPTALLGMSPSVLLEYTYFAGDDPNTSDELEGWDPIFASYPIFREELLPVMLRSNWTNLHQGRIEGRLAFTKELSAALVYAYLLADHNDLACVAGGGQGGSFGHLVSAFVDYKPLPWLAFALEIAEFFPGDYWNDANNATWGRFQTTVTF